MASSSGMSTSGASPVPRPQPPSLRFLDAEMDLALPPSLFSATMPEIISTTATHVPMHQVCGPLTTKLPGSMPGSGNPLVVSAVAAEQPPIPPLYGQSSPSSSSDSSTSSLSLRSGPLVNVQFERALDRLATGDLHLDAPPVDPNAPRRWVCW